MRKRKKREKGDWRPTVPQIPTRRTLRPKAAVPRMVRLAAGQRTRPPPPESVAVRRWVPCAPGYTTPGAVRLTAPRHSVDSCNLMNGFGCNSSFSTLVVWKPEYISQFGSSCADVSLRLMSENNLCPRSYFTVEEGPCMFSQEPCGISMLLLLPC